MNKELRAVIKKYDGCTRCPLHARAHNYVWYRGDSPCDVLFIGEAPGKDEDLVGQPFVGRAGDVLNEWLQDSWVRLLDDGIVGGQISEAIPFTAGITNVVRCIPWMPDKSKIRAPSKAEAAACSPILQETILAANPRLIILLGREAEKHHKIPEALAHIPVVHIKHPAGVLREGGIGSLSYDQNLLLLVDALEQHLYPESIDASKKKKPRPKKESIPRKGLAKKKKRQICKAEREYDR